MAFLLPLLLLAILWNGRAIKKQHDINILISSHLILVCALPIFLRLLDFVYELLPYQLLAGFIARLEQMNLGFLWNYIAIFCGIGGGLLLIAVAQRTFFSPARLRNIRLRKIQCRECGEKLQAADQIRCEICGAQQCANCSNCGKLHRLLALHCQHCGQALKTSTN